MEASLDHGMGRTAATTEVVCLGAVHNCGVEDDEKRGTEGGAVLGTMDGDDVTEDGKDNDNKVGDLVGVNQLDSDSVLRLLCKQSWTGPGCIASKVELIHQTALTSRSLLAAFWGVRQSWTGC